MNFLYRYSKHLSRSNLYPLLRAAIAEHQLHRAHHTLNIGAGGEIAEVLLAAGVRGTSVDVDADRCPDVVASAEDLRGFPDESVDAVFCMEVLEHVEQPAKAAKEIFRVLRKGGLLVGSTPFLLGIHDAPTDYYRFTRHGLDLLFRDFAAVSLHERNGYFKALAALLARRFVVGSPDEVRLARLLSPLLLLLATLLGLLDRLMRCNDGTTGYFFVYRKPWS